MKNEALAFLYRGACGALGHVLTFGVFTNLGRDPSGVAEATTSLDHGAGSKSGQTRLARPLSSPNLVTVLATLLVASNGANLGSVGGLSIPAHDRPTLSSSSVDLAREL